VGPRNKRNSSPAQSKISSKRPRLKIVQVLRLQADVERLARAFLNETRRMEGTSTGSALNLRPPWIKALKPFITTQQEVVQAKEPGDPMQ